MKFLFLLLIASSFLSQAQSTALFNGENLDGWYMISQDDSPPENLFTVTDGTIHAYASQESAVSNLLERLSPKRSTKTTS